MLKRYRFSYAWQAKAQTKYADLASPFRASQYIACVHAWVVGVGNWQFLLNTEQLLTYFQAAMFFSADGCSNVSLLSSVQTDWNRTKVSQNYGPFQVKDSDVKM